jgi:antitoxin component of RelBE/YafQ-DinJ toxin-antitoxin module
MQIEIDGGLLERATRYAAERGVTIEQLVSEFLTDFVRRNELADEIERLSRDPKGDSRGWKFNREEIQRKV